MTEPPDPGFCPRCGGALRAPSRGESGHARCRTCGSPHWENTIPVAGILLVREGHVLLTRRDAGLERGAGRWAFPGGFVEAGETAEEAALRETREEAGLQAAITGIVGRPYSIRDPAQLVIVYRGQAGPSSDARAGPEVSEVRWFAADAIPWDEIAFPSTEAALHDLLAEGLDGPPAHPIDPSPAQSFRSARAPPRFCRRCGGAVRRTVAQEEGHGVCTQCDTPVWSNPTAGASMHVIRDGRVLLTRRASSMSRGGGRWTGPGGHIEPGETAEEAVRRELAEEAGIEVTVTGLTGVYSKRDPAVVFVAYRGATDGEPAAGDETDEVRWFAPHEVPWEELFEDSVAPMRDLLARGLD